MVYERRKSTTNHSLAESEIFYTPHHNYNTRLSAQSRRRIPEIPQNLTQVLDFQRAGGDHHNNFDNDTYLVEEYEHSSDRFSVASSTCFRDSLHSFSEVEDKSSCEERLAGALVTLGKPMYGPPCNGHTIQPVRRTIQPVLICLVLGVAVLGYINYLRIQMDKFKLDIESANGRISDIVDARLDTLYKLSEVTKMVKEVEQSQMNFKHTMQRMIETEINKMYSDKTGRTDFALESAGGRIVQLAPGTENYGQPKSSLLGISLCDGMHGPRAMIQTGTSPGECWAFKGSSGGAIIKLLGSTKIDAVSLEHISKTISPSGDSTTAPKDFTVTGMKSLTDRGILLGQFTYVISGPLVQMFPLSHPMNEAFDFVELRVMSNHGNEDFTCVYRFRVHGTMIKPENREKVEKPSENPENFNAIT